MSALHFQHPERIHLLWAVLAWLGLWWALHRRGQGVLERFVGRPLQSRLVHRLPTGRWWMRWACFGLAGVALVFAVMRPQWGLRYVRTPRAGAEMMICLDVSKSMLAEDAVPSRLERAKADVSDLLGYLEGDHVGLIAFAGKATVLCPLTPDFGFFRLVLEGAGPDSVSRGGTNLEAALRKAMAGFRTEADVSRVIVLITDGEDHDNFPLEAADELAERGVRVLTIGFGSEEGSEIFVRNEDTGARTQVRDQSGNAVRTRLDGDLLREVALKTSGAYIPAGTGSLDLRSIYTAHIAPLARGQMDGRGRPVRHEGFQWAILLALVSLTAGVALGTGRPDILRRFREFGLALALLALAPGIAHADDDPPADDASTPDTEAAADPSATTESSKDKQPGDPRDAYNAGFEALTAGTLDEAERLFLLARTHAHTDGAVRFRGAFNLGWVEVGRANAVLEKEPKQALEHLERAADWFRDAVRLRPERTDARSNLEIILRRIRELADAIAKNDERDVVKELDELIKAQRGLVGDLATATDMLESQRDEPTTRRAFRRLATTQRQRLSDGRGILERVALERQQIEDTPKDKRKPEQQMRSAQLGAAQTYVQSALQRLGQARSQLRRRSVERAFRRSAAGLAELKQARDQFRNPIEILDKLLADGARVTTHAGQLVSLAEPPPRWLTYSHVNDERDSLHGRANELYTRLKAGLELPPPEPKEGEDPKQAEQAKRVRAQLEQALPSLGEAVTAFEQAKAPLDAHESANAQALLTDAVEALAKAREVFLDLKRLIELSHQAQSLVVQGLSSEATTPEDIQAAAKVQTANEGRVARLEGLLAQARTDAEQAAQAKPEDGSKAAAPTPVDPNESQSRKAYWDKAESLLMGATQLVDSASSTLAVAQANPGQQDERQLAAQAAVEARDALDALRRHFFTLVERLRERLQEQLNINDETTAVLGIEDDPKRADTLGAIDSRQDETQRKSMVIATALRAQAERAKAQPAQPPQPGQPAQPGPSPAERMVKAASHVDTSIKAMDQSRGAFKQTPIEPETITAPQATAAEELAKAIAALQPPQQDKNDDKQQEQKPKEQDQDQQAKGDQAKNKPKDSGGMLQSVRDREAKRRAAKRKKAPPADGAVEKDW